MCKVHSMVKHAEGIEAGLAEWIAAARAAGCFADDDDAANTLIAVFEGLGEVFVEDERRALARVVPTALRDAMEATVSGAAPRDAATLLARVARRRGLDTAAARERITTICELVSARLSDDARDKLVGDLPPVLGELFALRRPPWVRYQGHAPPPPTPHETLSSGRPGSKHPISEARPHRVSRGPTTD